MRTKTSSEELKKRRKKLFTRPDSAIGKTKNSNQKVAEKKSTKGMSAKDRAKAAAKARIAAKKAGTYKKPMTAKELAKKRLKIKK